MVTWNRVVAVVGEAGRVAEVDVVAVTGQAEVVARDDRSATVISLLIDPWFHPLRGEERW